MGKYMEKINWAPLENTKIQGVLDLLVESLLKIKGIESYRNPGKSDYLGFRRGNMKGVAFIHLSEKRARVSIGEAVPGKNGRVKGQFPKHLTFKATESGFTWGDKKIKVSQIVKRAREYIKARGWA